MSRDQGEIRPGQWLVYHRPGGLFHGCKGQVDRVDGVRAVLYLDGHGMPVEVLVEHLRPHDSTWEHYS